MADKEDRVNFRGIPSNVYASQTAGLVSPELEAKTLGPV